VECYVFQKVTGQDSPGKRPVKNEEIPMNPNESKLIGANTGNLFTPNPGQGSRVKYAFGSISDIRAGSSNSYQSSDFESAFIGDCPCDLHRAPWGDLGWRIRASSFGFLSDFGFRPSDFIRVHL
jgi:hypothetical protein